MRYQCFLFCIKYLRGVIISILKINLNELRLNIKRYRTQLNKNQKFCAVVKANAYGLGVRVISREINELVDYFAVSSAEEFWEIKNIVSKPVLILDPIYENITKLAQDNCEFCVSNFKQLQLIINLADVNNKLKFKLHLAFNTGMNRFGFNSENEIVECFKLLEKTQNVTISGVFSHFYAGDNEYFAEIQSIKFLKLRNFLSKKIEINTIVFHIANTSGFENQINFDMIRIGIGLFLFNNNSVFELESNIVEIQSLKKGDCAGYGRAFIATQNTKVAVVAIGYADGVLRKIAGRGSVLVNGCFCKVLAVCMDSIIIDISNTNAELGDKVTLIGENSGSKIFVCDFASWCDTIDYEIMTRISNRVKRVYIGGGVHADHNRKISCKKT